MGPRIGLADQTFFLVPVRAGSLSAAALELGISTWGVNKPWRRRRSAWAWCCSTAPESTAGPRIRLP